MIEKEYLKAIQEGEGGYQVAENMRSNFEYIADTTNKDVSLINSTIYGGVDNSRDFKDTDSNISDYLYKDLSFLICTDNLIGHNINECQIKEGGYGNKIYKFKIDDNAIIKWTQFKTTIDAGSLTTDAQGTIIRVFANKTDNDGTMKSINRLSNEVYLYFGTNLDATHTWHVSLQSTIGDITSQADCHVGIQAYGNVGDNIRFVEDDRLSYVYLSRDTAESYNNKGVIVCFNPSQSESLKVGSYVLYVGERNVVTRRRYLGQSVERLGTNVEFEPSFEKGETGLYVNGITLPSVRIFSKFDTLTKNINKIESTIGISQSLNIGFQDFGVMPSCIKSDENNFLPDGLINSDEAIIKYNDVISKYDLLVSKYPNYVKKRLMGKDASGTIDIYTYTFTPKYYTQSIYLEAAMHGWEPESAFALAEIMYLIADSYDTASSMYRDKDILRYIRGNVKITVNPVVNPWGFNNRGDCGIDKREVAQNNANGVQLNGNAAAAVREKETQYIFDIIDEQKDELSFLIDMHTTVWTTSRDKYGCFYGVINRYADNVVHLFRTYEWLYEFYDVKYPDIVRGDTCPNFMDDGTASIGYSNGNVAAYIYKNYGIQSCVMEFSDHVWTPELHTSAALSVAVNMYLNQIIQLLSAGFVILPASVPPEEYRPAKG